MIFRVSRSAALLAVLFGAFVASCRRPEIRVYTAPKDPPPPSAAAEEPPANRPKPRLAYDLPAGWKEAKPSEVSVADFTVAGDGGEASINVTPLPNLEGREAMVVNMYRQKVGQPPLEQKDLAGVFKPVEVAGGPGQLLEIAGQGGDKPLEIVTAIAHRNGRSWFIRMGGDSAFVEAQKPAFFTFLKSLKITEAEPGESGAVQTSDQFKWQIPAGWRKIAAGQMQVAKFSVPEHEGGKAEVSVSTFPSDTGGLLANVNRWRKQVGLPDLAQSELGSVTAPLEGGPPESVVVSLTNAERALVGAIVPREGTWWFYKLLGSAPVVSAERAAFLQFAKAQP